MRLPFARKAATPPLPEADQRIVSAVSRFTLVSTERLLAVIDAARYVSKARIPGAIVECGVWKGGCAMAAVMALMECQDFRDIYLFDTFEGMTEPSSRDGQKAIDKFKTQPYWCAASLSEVREAMISTGYPTDRMHFIQGRVEDTIPGRAPVDIAMLRLDTDWYESTMHELIHLYPRLTQRGPLLLDDYGHWPGARQAVDEYFAGLGISPLLARSDYTGRMTIKT
jgi:hypothetical protein